MTADPKYTCWNDDVHRDIMMAMYEALQPDKAQFAEIMTKLRQMGHKFSVDALKYAFLSCGPFFLFSHIQVSLAMSWPLQQPTLVNNYLTSFTSSPRTPSVYIPLFKRQTSPLYYLLILLFFLLYHGLPTYRNIMATDGAGRTVWNDKTRSDLLLAIHSVWSPTSEQWDAISVELRAKGYTYNYSAAV